MNTELTLYSRKASAIAALTEARDEAAGEWTPELEAKFDRAEKDLNAINREIKAYEVEQSELLKKEAAQTKATDEIREEKKVSYDEALEIYMRHGMGAVTPEGQKKLAEQRGTSTQITSTDSLGGYFVPDLWASEIVKTMLAFGGMMEASRIVPVSIGGNMYWPTSDQTSQKGAIVSQGTAGTVQDFSLGETNITDFTYRSGIIKVAVELMQDSAFPLVPEVNAQLGERLGRILNEHFTTGTGSGEPSGFVTDASTGKTSAINTGITWDEILDLVHSVDPAYRKGPSVAFMFNDTVLSNIRKLTVGSSDDRPIWQESLRAGEPDTLFGYRYVINQDMADFGSSAKPIAFGDWSKYIIKQVAGVTIQRYNERFMDSLAFGFQGFARYGGKLIDTDALKVMAMPA